MAASILLCFAPVGLRQPALPSFSLIAPSSVAISPDGSRHWASSSEPPSLPSLLYRYGVEDHVIASVVRSLPRAAQKKWKAGMRISLDMHHGQLRGITLYSGVFQAWKGSFNPKSQWQFVAYRPPVERSYHRIAVQVGGQTLSNALIAQAPSPAMGEQLFRSCRDSGIPWGFLRNSTVHMMYQTLRNTDTKEEGLGHIAMVRIVQPKGHSKTYYAYAPEKHRRFAFYTIAGVCSQHSLVSHSDTWGHPLPTKRKSSSSYGMRIHPTLGTWKFHKGTDFPGAKGTPILATAGGIVRSASSLGSYGKRIEIQHSSSYRSLYAHLNHYANGIRPGAYVRKGQVIGYMGNTGRTSGVHLHFEIQRQGRPVNPAVLLGQKSGSQHKQGFSANQLRQFKSYVSMLNKQYLALGRCVRTSI